MLVRDSYSSPPGLEIADLLGISHEHARSSDVRILAQVASTQGLQGVSLETLRRVAAILEDHRKIPQFLDLEESGQTPDKYLRYVKWRLDAWIKALESMQGMTIDELIEMLR